MDARIQQDGRQDAQPDAQQDAQKDAQPDAQQDARMQPDARMLLDPPIQRLAARQHGAFSGEQLRRAGVPGEELARMVRRRLLDPVHRHVYRVGGDDASPFACAMAAIVACLPSGCDDAVAADATASHWTAATLWQFAPDDVQGTAHVICPRQVRVRGVSVHRLRLPADERVLLRGVPVTTPARTILDLAAVATSRELEQAHALAERMGRVRREEIWAIVGRHPRARGIVLLRRLLTELDALGLPPMLLRSRAEGEARDVTASGGLPRPLANAHVLGLEVDFLWPALRLIMEVDGLEFHSSPEAVQRDRARDRILVQGGYMVLRFTWRQLTVERDVTLATLAAAIGARQQLLALGALVRE